ncbi:hypothetical protein [Nocardia aurea]|uniref:hypothetical protein n=1 Tax=Nocardia aurea TaxID=2144174 RepID=UPI0033A25FE8
MRSAARLTEVITAFVCAVIGGMALTTPISLSWARGAATLEMELLATSLPRAVAVGCLVAVVVTVFTSTTESLLVPWVATLSGMAVLLANHLLGRRFSEMIPLTTLNFIDSLAGGLVLGGAAAAVAVRLSMTLAFILGALTSIIAGGLTMSPVDDAGGEKFAPIAWWIIASPSLWFIWPGALLVLWCARRFRSARRYLTIRVELPMRPILAAAIAVSVPVVMSEWLVTSGYDTPDLVLVSVLVVVKAFVVGWLLPGRDGVLIQLCSATSAIGGAIVLIPLAEWLVPLLIASMALGLWCGMARPSPVAAMAGLLALSIFVAVAAGPHTSVPGAAIVGTLVLSLLTGYSFGAALPGQSSSVMLSIAVLFVPGVVIAMRGRIFTTDPGVVMDNSVPGLAAILITVGAACGLLLLRRRPLADVDPVTFPAPAAAGGAGGDEA